MRRALAVLATGLVLGGIFGTTSRADMYHPGGLNSGGGVTAAATILNTPQPGANSTFSWYGMQGYYSLEASPSPTGPWSSLGSTAASDFAWSLTVPNPDPTNNSYFFRLNQNNSFVGSGACAGCHGDKATAWNQTVHASALSALTAIGMGNNASCLPCHTVGFGQQTGYTNSTLTPHLANVGCETCHGPAGWHKNGDHSTVHPAVSIDPQICGSCHQGSHHPTYTEYAGSLHNQVNDDIKYGFNSGVYYTNTIVLAGKTLYGYYVTTNADLTLKTNATTGIISSSYGPANNPIYDAGIDRAASCGICHSGAARMVMLNDYKDRLAGKTNALVMPSGKDSGAWGPTCAVCHDPHADYNVAQLRNPTWSSNYYTMPTTTDKRTILSTNFQGGVTTNVVFMNTPFATYYNPNINICGQCHNTRGARWDGLAFGLFTNTVVSGLLTNVVNVPIYTSVTNSQVFTNAITGLPYTNTYISSYQSGYYQTNVVTTLTNSVITAGLTTNVTGYSRAPHNSVQYNILIGILQPDYLNTTNGKTVYTNSVLTNGLGIYATHSGIAPRTPYNTNQCATCHVPKYSVDANTVVTGHSFDLDTKGCALGGCHTTGVPDIEGTQVKTTNNIARVVDLLNRWATNNAPAILGATDYNKSKQNSWEFTSPGLLAGVTNAGPSATNQLKLPAVIRQARFNTYMVRNDGSLGVHNPTFIPLLLRDAESKVLSQFTTAKFTANSPDVLIGTTVTFTNLNPGVTACTWDFGDGVGTSTSTAATVTYTYTTVGTYSVTLTATDASGTETLVRNNYITTYDVPVPSYTATPSTGPAPLTVNFTNTSANASYSKWTFYDNSGIVSTAHRIAGVSGPSTTFTYTNAGTYKIVFQAANPGGSVNVTNSITAN
jgi:PKD repeat protein